MEYFGQIIIFFAALIAIKGNTWDESKSGIKKLTTNGWLTMILALIGLIVSCVVVYQANRSSKVESLQLSEALQNTKDAKKSADSLRIQLDQALENTRSANGKVEILEAKIDVYKSVLEEIRKQSDRQPQQVMAQYVQLEGRRIWRAPNLIYSGSKIKLYGFTCDILLRYGGDREIIPAGEGGSRPVETAIIGSSGQGMVWSLENTTGEFCHGKVYVESTPRSRSIDWSWVEEKIKSANSDSKKDE